MKIAQWSHAEIMEQIYTCNIINLIDHSEQHFRVPYKDLNGPHWQLTLLEHKGSDTKKI